MSFLVRIMAVALLIGSSFAFAPVITRTHHRAGTLTAKRDRQQEDHFLLQEFRTHSGEVLNPYLVLKVSRTATITEIKDAYRALSKRYHPDIMRHKDILPGSWYV